MEKPDNKYKCCNLIYTLNTSWRDSEPERTGPLRKPVKQTTKQTTNKQTNKKNS